MRPCGPLKPGICAWLLTFTRGGLDAHVTAVPIAE